MKFLVDEDLPRSMVKLIKRYGYEAVYAGIVVLEIPNTATALFILNLAEKFFLKPELVSGLRGTLAIVEPGRVRIRKD